MDVPGKHFLMINSKGEPFDRVKGKTYILPENLFLNLIKDNEKLATSCNDLLSKYSNSSQIKSLKNKALKK
jgi:hypothetical protein